MPQRKTFYLGWQHGFISLFEEGIAKSKKKYSALPVNYEKLPQTDNFM